MISQGQDRLSTLPEKINGLPYKIFSHGIKIDIPEEIIRKSPDNFKPYCFNAVIEQPELDIYKTISWSMFFKFYLKKGIINKNRIPAHILENTTNYLTIYKYQEAALESLPFDAKNFDILIKHIVKQLESLPE